MHGSGGSPEPDSGYGMGPSGGSDEGQGALKLSAADLVFSRPIPTADAPEKDPLTVPASPPSVPRPLHQSRPSTADSKAPPVQRRSLEHVRTHAPLASEPPSPTLNATKLQPAGRPRELSISSDTTYNAGAADSIFRLLPRESRNAVARMLTVEPSIRATLADLLRGGEDEPDACACEATVTGLTRTAKADPFLAGLRTCVGGSGPADKHIKAGDLDHHQHVLIGSNGDAGDSSKRKRK